jgi:hypothetical protein
MDIQQIKDAVADLHEAFAHIQQPRSDYQLRHFVVGQHDTEPNRYAQCVLELQIKYNAIRRGLLAKQKLEIEIQRLIASGDEIDAISADEKKIDIEEVDLAISGAFREFQCLYAIWKSFSRQYTHQELQEAQEEYWQARLTRQAIQDLHAAGRISQGNQDALRQAGHNYEGESDAIHSLLAGNDPGRGRAALQRD